jgi:putative membrane protein
VAGRHAAGNVGFVAWLAITLGINVLALLVINWLFDSVAIDGFWSYALGALALTIGNAILKPILAVLTLPLIIFTLGIAYFAINVAMLAFAEWVAPHFSIDGFWTYVGATIVVWLVNVAMQGLLSLMSGGGRGHARSSPA